MTNRAAWSDGAGKAFRVGDAPNWPVGADEVKIRNHAVAINPGDHKILDSGLFVKEWPTILGFDISGEIVEIGSKVTSVKIGDRVAVSGPGFFSDMGNKSSAFQLYTVVPKARVARIPDSLSYADASVFPLGIATAATAMFPKFNLGLDYPTVPAAKSNGKVFLVWGGSSSVGASAIALAVHAGYEVIATAGRQNFDLVKGFGAKHVFDYKSPSVIDDIVSLLKGREQYYVGAFTGNQDYSQPLFTASVAEKLGLKDSIVGAATGRLNMDGLPANIRAFGLVATQIFTDSPFQGFEKDPKVGAKIFGEWLPAALEAGSIKPVPSPIIVGHGLESVQEAVDRLRKGVSGQKLVVTL